MLIIRNRCMMLRPELEVFEELMVPATDMVAYASSEYSRTSLELFIHRREFA